MAWEDWRTAAVQRLYSRDPDLAYLLMEVLQKLDRIETKPRVRMDMARLMQPQTLIFLAGVLALLLQAPLPVIIDLLKAAGPFMLP